MAEGVQVSVADTGIGIPPGRYLPGVRPSGRADPQPDRYRTRLGPEQGCGVKSSQSVGHEGWFSYRRAPVSKTARRVASTVAAQTNLRGRGSSSRLRSHAPGAKFSSPRSPDRRGLAAEDLLFVEDPEYGGARLDRRCPHLGFSRASRRMSLVALGALWWPVPPWPSRVERRLPADQLPMPAEHRVRRDQEGGSRQNSAQRRQEKAIGVASGTDQPAVGGFGVGDGGPLLRS